MKKSRKEHSREYYLKNKEEISKRCKIYYLKNKEEISKRCKIYNLKNKEHKKEYDREYHLKNKEHRNKKMREHYLQKKEHYQEQQKGYTSKPKTQELRRNRDNNRYQTDVNYRLLTICRARIYQALKFNCKSASTTKLIGCTVDELRQHIESKFEPWMNWENQGLGGWDIEHIIACAKFNLIDPEQQRACFNWSNLQPMEHIANIKKGAR